MLQYQERGKMGGEKFHIRKGALTFSADSISLELVPGSACEGSFTIYGPEGRAVNGFVTAEMPVQLLSNVFSGAKEVIAYRVDASHLTAGDILDGCFRIFSDSGEYRIPFHAEVKERALESSLGPMKNLLHFTNLARSNWHEAAELFYRGEFEAIAAKEGENIHTLYRALSARKGNEHNIEEFLIAAGKKQPVEFSADQKEITAEITGSRGQLVQKRILVRRNGWGYSRVKVSLEGDFLTVSSFELTDLSFREGAAELSLTADPAGLHQGRNFGAVVLTPDYGKSIRIPVTIAVGVDTALRTLHRRQQRQIILQMMQEYVGMRCHKCTGREFAEHMGSLVLRLQESDRNNPMAALYKIHYLLTVHKEQEAVWELQTLNRRLSGIDEELPPFSVAQFDLEDDLTYSYRMYLTILCAEAGQQEEGIPFDTVEDALRGLARRQRKSPENFWITWLLLYADAERMRRPGEAARLLRRPYEAGSRSPILYLEYYQMMQESPEILYDLGDFELQTLYFAAKHEILTEAVITQLNYLAIRRKTFSGKLFQILTRAFAMSLSEVTRREVLESICTLLIRGNETDPSCFPWYQKGVEAGLGITRLLDYYMLALPEGYDGPLPQMVVRYFAYQNSLPWTACACLYRYVLQNSDTYQDLMDQYRPKIDQFTADQLLLHRMNRDLAYLYEKYLTAGRALTEEIAAAAVPAAFSCQVQADERGGSRAVLVYECLRSEQYAPLLQGAGILPVYGENAVLLFEEDNGDRHVGKESQKKMLMDPKRLVKVLSLYEVNNIGFELYLSGAGTAGGKAAGGRITSGNAPHYRSMVQNEEIPERFRRKLRRDLLRFYEKQEDNGALDELLQELEPDGMDAASRNEVLYVLSVRGFFGKAYDWIRRYGCHGTDGAVLLRIASGLLEQKAAADDEDLTALCYTAYERGSYNEALLEYLAAFFDGLTEELEKLRLSLEGFGLEEGALCRRMLIQLLFTGEPMGNRGALILGARKDGTDSSLLADALAQAGHFYFVGHEEMSEEEFSLIAEYGREGVPLLDICRIAWLCHLSKQSGEIGDLDLEVTSLFLSDLLEQKIVFPFFRQFVGVLPGLQAYADETLVEYRCGSSGSGKRVLYHYAMERNGVRDPYAAREMKEMYEGVYVTGFLLFFGEQMHYYITDDDAEKNVVESGTIGQDARTPVSGQDRFSAINEIAMLTALGRDAEALGQLEKYSRKAYLVSRLFDAED